MSEVLMKLTVHARGLMATKLLDAAKELGLPPGVIRSQSEGFKVPEEVHRYLFPSSYAEGETVVISTQSDAFTEHDPQTPPNPAADFADLTEAEQEALTNPNQTGV